MPPIQMISAQVLQLTDLTSLNTNDTPSSIIKLCHRAKTPIGTPAAICIYPQFIAIAKEALQKLNITNVQIATVVNFPQGMTDIDAAVLQTRWAISQGANEIDVVFPYQALLEGDAKIGQSLVRACKAVCGPSILLKVIIETGALKTTAMIQKATLAGIQGGADFIKTSTGKITESATLRTARIILEVIKKQSKDIGFKAAGGIKTVDTAHQYLQLAAAIMGASWITPRNYRFGASSLLDDILQKS